MRRSVSGELVLWDVFFYKSKQRCIVDIQTQKINELASHNTHISIKVMPNKILT